MKKNTKFSLADVHAQGVENAVQIALVQQSLKELETTVKGLSNTVNIYINGNAKKRKP